MAPSKITFILAVSSALLASSMAHAQVRLPFDGPTLLGLPRQQQNFPLRPLPKQPLPIIDECTCTATTFIQGPGGLVTPVTVVTPITAVTTQGIPRDTCPSGSILRVRWHAEPHPAIGYRYKLDFCGGCAPFIEVGPNVRSVSYDLAVSASGETLAYATGPRTFTLGARGLNGTYVDSTRAFQLNYPPDTWWSGPDRSSPSLFTKPNGEKYALLVGGELPGPILGSLLSDDSVQVMPASRAVRRSFFEVWKDTVWVRQEGDTVHLNSWVILHNGGLDRDSPYSVKVTDLATTLPGFPGGPVLEPGPANGSPIGFRSVETMSLTPLDQPSRTALSGFYPIFDPNSVFNLQRIAGYHSQFLAGRAFAVVQAEDANGDRDRRVPDGRDLVLRIENGTATPYEQSLRSLVLTFEVDRPPYFVTESPVFVPQPQQTFTTSVWSLSLVATDPDPFQAYSGTPPGGPSANVVLRRKIKVHGKDAQGNDFTYVDPLIYVNQQNISITVPAALAPGPCAIEVELCDCEACEDFPGTGRCVTSEFPVMYAPTGSAASTAPGKLEPGLRTFTTALLAPYPNPASRGTTIPFTLAHAGEAAIEIFDLTGHRVRSFAESLPSGQHSRTWAGVDERGQPVAAGIYFVRLRTAEFSATRKVLVAP